VKSEDASTIRNPNWSVDDVHGQYSDRNRHSDLYRYIHQWTDMERYLNVGYSMPWHVHMHVSNHHRLIDRLAHPLLELHNGGPHREDRRLLDIASGRGGAAVYAARTFGLDVTGIDITPYNIELARKHAITDGVIGHVRFDPGDALSLPYPNDHFPMAWSIESPAHFPDKKQFLQEAFRVLKPGGAMTFCDLLVVNDVALASEKNRKIYEEFLETWDVPYLNTAESYRSAITDIGFELSRVEVVTRRNLRIYQRYCHIFLTLSKINWLYSRHTRTIKEKTGANLDNVHAHTLASYNALKLGMIDYGLFWLRVPGSKPL
jgi:ubiquinone/menaquinone biosynthesis C-methylase UbiE